MRFHTAIPSAPSHAAGLDQRKPHGSPVAGTEAQSTGLSSLVVVVGGTNGRPPTRGGSATHSRGDADPDWHAFGRGEVWNVVPRCLGTTCLGTPAKRWLNRGTTRCPLRLQNGECKMNTNSETARPALRGAHGRRRPASTNSFSPITQIARGLGIGFRPDHNPDLAEGVLMGEEDFHHAVLSYQPKSLRLRLLTRVAHVDSLSAQLAARLLRLQTSSTIARFGWDEEADHSLFLEATTPCPPDTDMVPDLVKQVFDDLQVVLWDPSLRLALETAGARICVRTAPRW